MPEEIMVTSGPEAALASAADAARWMTAAEAGLLDLWIARDRANWVHETYITDDTAALAARANEAAVRETMRLAREATRFAGLALAPDLARKFRILATSLTIAAPSDPAKSSELARIATALDGTYGKGRYVPPDGSPPMELHEISNVVATSRDPERLRQVWLGWHAIAVPMRDDYSRLVALANEGARELGFADTGALWRSKYDRPAEEFARSLDRLWGEVAPLYRSLHAYVRARLVARYGAEVVPPEGPIPAHLLGNLWAQAWGNVYDIVRPGDAADPGFDLTEGLRAQGYDPIRMVRTAEQFFVSLGLEPLPRTFWERSMFVKPRDRDVVCHASAWDVDQDEDLRVKMCIEVSAEDFATVHHELGHNFYQRAYRRLPPLFRDSANDGFHEALGDTIALSVTPKYLARLGLIDVEPPAAADIALLLRMALDKVAFLPFGLTIDKWRWGVFSGAIAPRDYNRAWWDLKREYQGVAPAAPRTEADFDPGAKYHVASSTPYMRYFLAHVLQFQLHRALTDAAGETGPLHRRSIHGSRAAGERLAAMMEMGLSRPWPDALEALTGERELDASALLEYFAPLQRWLDGQTRGRPCGW